MRTVCAACDGSGTASVDQECPDCDGTGLVPEKGVSDTLLGVADHDSFEHQAELGQGPPA